MFFFIYFFFTTHTQPLPCLHLIGPHPRSYNQALIEDSAAVTAAYGLGSMFITMTCNPAWREITEALEPGQTYNDRPDLMARV